MEKPNIYKYHDYLLFFKDWISYKQESDLKFSLRKWSQIVEASPSLLTMILKNEREISESLFYRMIQQMDLKKNEREAFSLLRKIATSENSEDRITAYNQLIKIPDYKKENFQNLKAFEYLSNWLHIAIRELSFTPDFKDDPAWIRSRIRVYTEKKEIERSLDYLKENAYLVLNENKKWKPQDILLDCSDGVYKLSLSEIHRKMLDIAANAIDEVPRKNRFIAGHTFAVDNNQFEEAKKILEEALYKIQNLDSQKSDNLPSRKSDVYHMELVLFPITNVLEDSKNE